jgi:hypothetical protein
VSFESRNRFCSIARTPSSPVSEARNEVIPGAALRSGRYKGEQESPWVGPALCDAIRAMGSQTRIPWLVPRAAGGSLRGDPLASDGAFEFDQIAENRVPLLQPIV